MFKALFSTKIGKYASIIVLLSLIAWWQWDNIRAFFQAQRKVSNNKPLEGGGDVSPEWVKQELPALVTRTYQAITEWLLDPTTIFNGSERCDVLKRLNDLNDNQLRVFSNQYRRYYKRSFPDDIAALYDDGCSIGTTDGIFKEFLNKKLDQRIKYLSIV